MPPQSSAVTCLTMDIERRRELVSKLINYEGTPQKIVDNLRAFGWDSDQELVHIAPEHLHKVLDLYISGQISESDLVNWAGYLECRDDIGFDEKFEDVLRESIFWLANPEINFPITIELAKKIKANLNI